MIEERRTADGGTIGLRVDITDLKKKEESFRLLFESNPVPMYLYDIAGQHIVSANHAAADHYGYKADHLGMKVTAEGIEQSDILDYLRQEGCEEGLGYFFAAAVSVEDLRTGSQAVHRAAA
jgi:PAS domain-containing protein